MPRLVAISDDDALGLANRTYSALVMTDQEVYEATTSEVVEYRGGRYIVLRLDSEVLAVYSVRKTGRVRREPERRWPPDLT